MTSTNEVDASSLLASGDGEDVESVCYLCLDGGADEPLRRDCACRGTDAGFVHLSCLTKYAATKSMQASDMDEFRKPWIDCPSCHQEYQNDLRIDITTKCVSFVRRQYPQDTRRQVEALHLNLYAFDSMFDRLQPVQKRKYGVMANVLLSFIDRMREEVSPLPMRYSWFEANAHHAHGHIALDEGTEESARRAVTHFENQLEVNEAIGDPEDIAIANDNIAHAKSKYESGNNEELLKSSQELYEIRVAELGEENEYTIHAGMRYAINLCNANRGDEARELLTKLLTTSKQVLGPHHNTTKDVEKELKKVVVVANQD
jgi:hypothetical protein